MNLHLQTTHLQTDYYLLTTDYLQETAGYLLEGSSVVLIVLQSVSDNVETIRPGQACPRLGVGQ